MQAMKRDPDLTQENLPDGSVNLCLSGVLLINKMAELERNLQGVSGNIASVDISGVSQLDTVGAWLVYRTARQYDAKIIGADSNASRLIAAVSDIDSVPKADVERPSAVIFLLSEIGKSTWYGWTMLIAFLSFLGQSVKAGFSLLIHPSRFRWHSVMQHFDMVGVRALAIIGLMSFLIGIVIAQQGAVQLRQFGAEVFTVNLIGRLTFRELGILMTAIMVAGRSGSAFAAQIGTMKITEEVDAMRTIGVSPFEALIIPRIIAAVIMMPLLGLYASLIAVIGGGLLCWTVLEIPPATYVQRLREVTPMTDVYIGMIKAPVFGAIIAVTGCFQGMLVQGNSEQVGLKTTAAVVQAIFLVIVLDAFFAVFFSSIGWD